MLWKIFFRYRFEGNNELSGHSFGNLFITALAQVYDGDIEEALEAASKLLRVRGRVIPSSTEFIQLSAELIDGTIVMVKVIFHTQERRLNAYLVVLNIQNQKALHCAPLMKQMLSY